MKILILAITLLEIFLIKVTHASHFENKALNEREGLQFEEVGDLKLITTYNKLTFNVNISEIQILMSATENLLNESRHSFLDDIIFQNETSYLQKALRQQMQMFGDIFYTSSQIRRKKRFNFDFFFWLDTQRRDKDLKGFREFTNELIQNISAIAETFNSSIFKQNSTNEILLKNSVINQIKIELEVVSEYIKSLLMMLQRKKLSEMFVTFSDFKSELLNIEKFARSDEEELPFGNDKINQYFYSLQVSHRVFNKCLILTVQVPFVEKITRKLYKIHEIPSYHDEKLMITDVEWKYMAVSNTDMVMFMDSKKCLNVVNPNTYFCEPESHTENLKTNSSCLGNAYKFKSIDSKLCKTLGAKFSKLTFIKLGNGEYFYYTPKVNEEIIVVSCNGSVQSEVLKNYTGILILYQGCRAKSDIYELISTKNHRHIERNLFINVAYTEGELEESLKNITNKFKEYSKAFDDLNVFRKELKDADEVDSKSESQTVDFGMDMMVIFATTFIIIFCLIVLRSICSKNCSKEKSYMSKKKENIILRIIQKD